ncbi:hypothetical protein HanOQP8_Chr12g0443931 [Helianthus annuus]|nr:hypothetical protein HanOQP8_Chr12g0443931 [Helianthus annuus]
MAPGKDNLSESVSVLTQRQLDKFVREYRIPLDLYPVLPLKNEIIYPFRQGKFPLYTCVCNFANYRVPFSKFLIRVLWYFRVHQCQVNPFGLSRVNHFEISCRALNQRPDLEVFRYFYELITAGDWYTFAHRKGIPSPSGEERSSLKNWKDNFFWLDDHCLPVEMVWRFKDQTMSFDLGEGFVFNQELARALIDNQSPILPLHEHFLLLGRICFSWGRGDRDWPVIRTKAETLVVETTSVGSGSKGDAAGSSAVQARTDPEGEGADSDPDVRALDQALLYRPCGASLKGKGISLNIEPKGLVHRKRKVDALQVRSSISLPMPKLKKTKSSSHSSDNVITELDEHLSGGKSSREEAALARSARTPAFSGGYLPENEAENMEVENPTISSKGDGEDLGGAKVVTFSGTILDSFLGPDCFIDDEEDQVSSLPPSWFGPELMSFFRYADVFADDMEIDPNTADDKFVLEWDIRNKDSVMKDLTARMFFLTSTLRWIMLEAGR